MLPNIQAKFLRQKGSQQQNILGSQTICDKGVTAPTYCQVDNSTLANSNTLTADTTGGPIILDDVSGLADVLDYTNLPVTYKYGAIRTWQRVNAGG